MCWRALIARMRMFDQAVLDWAVAIVLAVWGQIDLWFIGGAFTTVPGSRLLTAPFLLLFSLPLAVRRRWPFGVLCVVAGAIAFESIVIGKAPEGGEILFPTLITLYTVGAHSPTRRAVLGLALAQGAGAIEASLDPKVHTLGDVVIGDLFFWVFLGGAAWLTGRYARGRRLAAQESEDRAEGLERNRDELARVAVATERGRIARELHDVIAHSVSLMGVQAGAAERLLESDPGRAREALRSIQLTARESVGELRRLLDFLRTREEPTALAPQPGLDALESLIEGSRHAGLHVELAVEGHRPHLPAGVELSAYRVVQEALTNARKHAPGAPARVRLHYGPRELQLWVENGPGERPADGNGAAAPVGTGHGILGMRERVALYGGSVQALAQRDGGFLVHVRLPVGITA
jgi:signal transduction histidine kinase